MSNINDIKAEIDKVKAETEVINRQNAFQKAFLAQIQYESDLHFIVEESRYKDKRLDN